MEEKWRGEASTLCYFCARTPVHTQGSTPGCVKRLAPTRKTTPFVAGSPRCPRQRRTRLLACGSFLLPVPLHRGLPRLPLQEWKLRPGPTHGYAKAGSFTSLSLASWDPEKGPPDAPTFPEAALPSIAPGAHALPQAPAVGFMPPTP